MANNTDKFKYENIVEEISQDLGTRYFKTLCKEIDLNAQEIIAGQGIYIPAVDVELTLDEDNPQQALIKVWLRTADPTSGNYLRTHVMSASDFRPTPALKEAMFKLFARIAREYRGYGFKARVSGTEQNRFWLNLSITLK